MAKAVLPELLILLNAVRSASSERLANILIDILDESPEHSESVKEKLLLQQGQLRRAIEARSDDKKPVGSNNTRDDKDKKDNEGGADNEDGKDVGSETELIGSDLSEAEDTSTLLG